MSLVDISETPIERITATGLVVGDQAYEFDVTVFAAGFDAMTEALLDVDIRGRGGRTPREKWGVGPRTYLGLAREGSP